MLSKTAFCNLFYSAFGTSTFPDKVKNKTNAHSFVYVFLEGRRHKFSANLGSIWSPFWEASEDKSRKNEVPERCPKTALKRELQEREKVTQAAAVEGGFP